MGSPKRTEKNVESSKTERARVPDPEVPEKAQRRHYTAEYKLRVLEEADRCREPGEVGALLRREGLYSSLLSTWRRQRDEGSLSALEPRKRGRKAKPKNPLTNRRRLIVDADNGRRTPGAAVCDRGGRFVRQRAAATSAKAKKDTMRPSNLFRDNDGFKTLEEREN